MARRARMGFNRQLKPAQVHRDSCDRANSSKVGFLEEAAPLRPSRLMTVIGAPESRPHLPADTGASLQGHLNLEVTTRVTSWGLGPTPGLPHRPSPQNAPPPAPAPLAELYAPRKTPCTPHLLLEAFQASCRLGTASPGTPTTGLPGPLPPASPRGCSQSLSSVQGPDLGARGL